MGRIETNFKQTEVGLIPHDWEVKRLGDCLLKNPDYGINAAAVEYDDTLPTYLRITDISENGKFIISNKTSVNNPLSDLYCLDDGDIVFARTGASVGKTYLYDVNDGRLVFAGFLIRIKANPKVLYYRYFIHLTQTNRYWSWVLANSMRSGQPGLNSDEYKAFQIAIPPIDTKEQTAIANALSDADGYIESLEKLIDKKQKIKQGAMQQILKPKENWEVKKLGEVCKFQNGTALESYFNKEDGYKVISIGNYSEKGIFNETGNFIAKNRYENVKKFILEKGDLAFLMNDKTAIGTIIGRALFIEESDKYIFNQRTMRLVAVHKFMNPKFLFHLINSNHYHALFVKLAKPGTQIYLNTRDVLDFEIMIPALEEQLEIAQILSDIDNEITILNQKLTKAKAIKQGMMQQLLTGKIRLI